MSPTSDAPCELRASYTPTTVADGVAPTDRPDHAPAATPAGGYSGRAATAPYPLSRLAPAFQLTDLAAEIAKADQAIANVTSGKLLLIAEQIRALQERAREVLERARHDADLHRVPCRFEKKPFDILHLYREPDGSRNFSLFGPNEWKTKPQHTYLGSYRVEPDLSFTALEALGAQDADRAALIRLLPNE